MYSQRGPAYSNMVSINVSMPLQWDQQNRQDRELAAKLAMVEQMRAEREEATRACTSPKTRAMLQEWQSDRERLGALRRLADPARRRAHARSDRRLSRRRAARSRAVLEARRSEIDTRMERLRLEMEAARLWAQLEYLIPAGHAQAAPRRDPEAKVHRHENANPS